MRILATLIAFVFLAFSLAAQVPVSRQAVTGGVQDPTGAPISGATVELLVGGVSWQTATTDRAGAFQFSRVAAGAYQVQIMSPGFESKLIDLTIGSDKPQPLSISLSIAEVRSELTVTDDDAQVSTESSDNKDTVSLSGETLSNLPVFDQDYVGAMSRFLDPGSSGNGGVTLIVNGMEVNNLGVSSSAIKEIKINQDPYSAEFQWPGRGRIEIITKPGTSEYHGTFTLTFRDAHVNARDPFAFTRAPEQRRIFEGVLTGPLGHSKTTSFLISINRNEEDRQAVVFAEGPTGPIIENVPTPIRNTQFAAQINHSFSKNNNASIRYSYRGEATDEQGVGGTVLPEAGVTYRNHEQEITYSQETVLSPRLINNFRFFIGAEGQSSSSITQTPKIVVLDAFTGGGAQANQLRTEFHAQLNDVVTFTNGKHLIKGGLSIPDLSRRGLDNDLGSTGTFFFSSLADYIARRPFSFRIQQGNGHDVFFQKLFGAFAQDEYHLRPNLMFTAGVRYDWENYYRDHNNFSPRFSFAYSPGDRKTVIRGGAGIFYDRFGPRIVQDIRLFNGSNLRLYVLPDPGYPDPLGNVSSFSAQPVSETRLAPNASTPYTFQVSGGVERQLSKKSTLAVNFVKTRGFRLFRSRDLNAPVPPLYLARPDPAIGVLREVETAGRSSSNLLEVTFRGNATRYFTGMVQYRLSSNHDDTSGLNYFPPNSYDLSGEWARSDFDRRHRFEMLGTINPGKLFNLGISVSMASGAPYTLTTGRDDLNTGTANARPLGVPRNSLDGPGYVTLDLRWSRDFLLRKGKQKDGGLRGTLAVDAFNVLNHVNYTAFVGNESSPFFGRPVASLPPRRLQFSFRLRF